MAQLEDLLQQCTVKLTLGTGWGTGFFVAPGWILTCAHVVREARDEPVQVRWHNQENWAQAIVSRVSPEYDLALLRMTIPIDPHPPCVYLDAAIESHDPLYLFGYPDQDFPNGCPVTFGCEGLTGDEPALIKFAVGQVRPGMSGSPLLNQRSGMVCGMVKFTRDRSIDLGGGAIPTRVILAQLPELIELQQQYHQRDRRWHDRVTKQSEIDFQPYLNSIVTTYEKWWQLYTLTDAERKLPIFDFGLMVQTVQGKLEPLSVLEGIRKYADQHVLLIGRPGLGKSTALARLLLEEATTQTRIPVLVELRDWENSIVQLILKAFARHGLPLTEAQLAPVLSRSFLLFDGLNELPSETARSQLSEFRRNHSQLPMIFTTRDLSLGGDLGIRQRLEMQPLTDAQMQAFIRAYVPEQPEAMLRQLGDRLREFGQTPLVLWMLCEVFHQTPNHQLPSNLAGIFQMFTATYETSSVRKHEVALLKGDVKPLSDWRLWKKALQALASAMMQGETPIDFRVVMHRDEAERELSRIFPTEPFPVRDILDDLLKYHLLQNRSLDQIEFRHQLLQEYYAAEALLQRLPDLSDGQLQREYLNYVKWTEPLTLMLALVEQEAQALRVVKLALDVDLMLGARLAGAVKPAFQTTTVGLIDALTLPPRLQHKCWVTSHSEKAIPGLLTAFQDQNANVRRSAAEALGNLGSVEAIPGLLTALQHQNANVRGSAAYALGNLGRVEAIPGLLTALQHQDSRVRGRAAEALGKLGSVEAIPGLLTALQHQNANVRGSAAYALGNLGRVEAIPGLLTALQDQSEYVRGRAAEALGKLGSVEAIPGLLTAFQDQSEYVRRSAADALGKLGSVEAIPGLLTALQHPDDRVRRSAAYALGNLGSVEAIPGLLTALQDQSEYVRESAAYALGNLGSVEVIPGLLTALQDQSEYVRRSAAKALANLGSVEVIPGLLTALQDQSEYVRRSAAKALANLGSVEVIPRLLTALQDQSEYVRESAAKALANLGSVEVIPGLLTALQHQNDDVRGSAAKALGNLGSVEAIPGLLTALQDQNANVRGRAADALANLGRVEAIPGLLTALQDQNANVRGRAADALGNLGSVEAIPGLLTALQDQNANVRGRAADALGNLGSVEAIPGLLTALQDPDDDVRQIAAKALANLGSVEAIPGLLTALQDQNSRVRESAAEALGSLGSVEAIPRLLTALQDQDSGVRGRAAEALGKLGSPIPLSQLWQLCLAGNIDLGSTIAAIQNRCKFYNYEIWQAAMKDTQ